MLGCAGEADDAPDEGVVPAVRAGPVILGQQSVQAVAGIIVAITRYLDPDIPQSWGGHAHQRRLDGVAAGRKVVDAAHEEIGAGQIPERLD
ncbi:MAG: hypothetical protein M3515_02005 [Actinomycetota bacterium]|nr:hypothetical protein [Actinomycetota bacterium]